MTYKGKVKNGVVVFEDGVALPEGTMVQVSPVEATEPAVVSPSLVEGLLDWAGKGEGLPPDLARNHDHYLHGQPRK